MMTTEKIKSKLTDTTRKPKYIYDKMGSWWYVWELTYTDTGSTGHKVSDPMDKEEARKETYRLNGWDYTPTV